MPPPPRHAHTIDPVYADPVLRASSPSDSINTEYVPDETPAEQLEYSDADFAVFVEEGLGLGRVAWEDADSPRPVLLPKTKDPKEEEMMFDRVMRNLREKVKELEDEDLFEAIRHPGNGPGPSIYAAIPSSDDITAIMRGFMPSSTSTSAPTSTSAAATSPARGLATMSSGSGSGGLTTSSSGESFGTGGTVASMATTATVATARPAKANGKARAVANPTPNTRTRSRARGAANANDLQPSSSSGSTAAAANGMGRRQGLELGLGVGVRELQFPMGGRF